MNVADSADLVLVGASGLAREAVEVVHAVNACRPTWNLLGFLDDDPARHGQKLAGLPVLGGLDALTDLPGAQVVVCTGRPDNYISRLRIVTRLGLPAARYATLVHPAAVLPSSATVGHGSVVLAGVIATTDVHVGAHATVMPATVLTHDDVVGDYAILGAGVRLAGGVHVGRGAYVGSGALVREDRRIGDWSLVGMGAVVTRDVPAAEIWAGVPARRVRAAAIPADLHPVNDDDKEL